MGIFFPHAFCLDDNYKDCCENHKESNEFNRLSAHVRLEVEKTDLQYKLWEDKSFGNL